VKPATADLRQVNRTGSPTGADIWASAPEIRGTSTHPSGSGASPPLFQRNSRQICKGFDWGVTTYRCFADI
jgi:hypothetical protein